MKMLKILLVFLIPSIICGFTDDTHVLGDQNCPCINDIINNEVHPNAVTDDYNEYIEENILKGTGQNISTFGVGCKPHDEIFGYCEWKRLKCEATIPEPPECHDLDWCGRSWCYIDPKNCTLENEESSLFLGKAYSFATCGYMDTFLGPALIASLKEKNLKVAFAANTGGYLGAYNNKGSFAVNNDWDGPVVEFITRAALSAEFSIEIVSPPDHLRADANEYLDSATNFDFCVYAAALGYVDFCVGSFTVTTNRASYAPWFVLGEHAIQIVTFQQRPESALKRFWDDASTILKPFEWRVWIVMFLLFMPIMSFIILYFEYGKSEGAYPSTDRKDLPGYIALSLYEVLQSLFAGYGGTVVSRAGKAMMIGIGFFNMLILTTYTANLVAIFNSNDLQPDVTSLEEAYDRGYKICGERSHLLLLNATFPKVNEMILSDPVDGKPGFTNRKHVLDAMKEEVLPEDRERFCEAAFIINEDLVAMQGEELHCNKTMIGTSLLVQSYGFPMSPVNFDSLWAIFQDQYNEGWYDRAAETYKPSNQCDNLNAQAKTSVLSIEEMAGLWIGTFAFAIAGVIFHKVEIGKS